MRETLFCLFALAAMLFFGWVIFFTDAYGP